MIAPRKPSLDSILRRGETAMIYATTALLFVVEFCFVYLLYRLPLADRSDIGHALITAPFWYQRPRFEVTLLLTIVAGGLFSVCRALWELRRASRNRDLQIAAKQLVTNRLKATWSLATLTGCELLLVTWVRS